MIPSNSTEVEDAIIIMNPAVKTAAALDFKMMLKIRLGETITFIREPFQVNNVLLTQEELNEEKIAAIQEAKAKLINQYNELSLSKPVPILIDYALNDKNEIVNGDIIIGYFLKDYLKSIGVVPLKVFLLTQNQHEGYFTYQGVVVAAESADEAKKIHPSGESFSHLREWADSPDKVEAKYLGEADASIPKGIVCATYVEG